VPVGAVPALLEQARVNLRTSNARDLWVYGAGTLRNQSEVLGRLRAGTLDMRTLEGSKHADLAGAEQALLTALERAHKATDAFTSWIESERQRRPGPPA